MIAEDVEGQPPGLPYAVVDACVAPGLRGNPAAVVRLDEQLPDARLLALAQALDEPVTAFVVPRPEPGAADLRWFTRNAELRICGHATMAASEWLLTRDDAGPHVEWHTRAGLLRAWRSDGADGKVTVDLPQTSLVAPPPDTVDQVAEVLGRRPEACLAAGDDLLAVLASPAEVVEAVPTPALEGLDCRGLIVTATLVGTAQETDAGPDIASRFFAPRIAIPEDEVCISAHCALYPYWSARLGRTTLRAWQASPRGGALTLTSQRPGRVSAAGRCRLTHSGSWPVVRHG